MRVPQSKAELDNHLKEQSGSLRASMRSYDEGFEGEAKRLAVTIRVLVHNTSRSHAIRFHLEPGALKINSQNAETGEASETLETDYAGAEVEIGFNAQYLQDFLQVIGDQKIAVDLKDGNAQAQLRPVEDASYDYKYIVMPMRI